LRAARQVGASDENILCWEMSCRAFAVRLDAGNTADHEE
jgi:hypothetical protein